MNSTIAQLILQALASWGVKNIYGVSGDAILPVMDALRNQDQIKYYSTASEQGASFMACGEARVTGKPGVCLATEGPGALNLLNGVADAYRDGIPLLVLTGQVETAKLLTASKQYINQQQLFAPITGSTTLLTRPESTVGTLKIAMEKAIGDNTPCQVSLPKNILLSVVQNKKIPLLESRFPPNISGSIEKAINVIGSCHKPVIIAGRTAINFKELVFQLSMMIGAAIIPAQGARGIYPGIEKMIPGGLGEAHIPPLLKMADCVILIGSSPYEHKFIPKEIRVIQIDTCPQKIAHNLMPLAITGDIQNILKNLLKGLSNTSPDKHWQEEIRKNHEKYIHMIRSEANLPEESLSIQTVVSILNDIIPSDAVITIDSGEFMHWFDRGFIAKQQKVIISDNWRCMGCGLPFGLGAQIASPSKKIIVLTGDGGFIMTLQEMITAVRYSLPVVVIVFHDNIYALEKHRMMKAGMNTFGVDVNTFDFSSYAKLCGAEGIRVEDPKTLRETLIKSINANHPIIIDIVVNQPKPIFI